MSSMAPQPFGTMEPAVNCPENLAKVEGFGEIKEFKVKKGEGLFPRK